MEKRSGRGYTRVVLWGCAGIMQLSLGPAYATPIYKSVDAMGNVTYSATPPVDAVQSERMAVSGEEDVDSSAAHAAIIDEIRATAALLEADRKQREQARETARVKQQHDEDSKQESLPPQPIIQYYPVYPLRLRPPHRSGLHRHPTRRLSPEQQAVPERRR